MKKLVCMIGVFMIMTILGGCFSPASRIKELNRDSVSEKEAIERIEDTVIQALETKDKELLKSIFSEKALTKAGDMDKGIEYIFDLYKGDFVEITEEGHDVGESIEGGKKTKDIRAWCIIKTSEQMYKMSWVDWTIQDKDSSKVGVYKLQMREYIEGDYRSYCSVAGINYPERDMTHTVIGAIIDTFCDGKEDNFTSLLSTELMKKNNTGSKMKKLNKLLSSSSYSDVGDGWVTYDEVDGKEKMHTYFEVMIDDKPYIAYVAFDDVEQDKISVFQIVEDNGKDFKEETECGIYLP